MSERNPVTIITLRSGAVTPWYTEGPEPLIIDFDVFEFGSDCPEVYAAEYIETIITLPIDTIFRIQLVEKILDALGYDSDWCMTALNSAADNLNLPRVTELCNIRSWVGWTCIEQNRDVDGNYVYTVRVPA